MTAWESRREYGGRMQPRVPLALCVLALLILAVRG